MKDVFRNISVTPQHQQLLGFRWKGKFYKKTCLLFGLTTASFIFNLFVEPLYWLITLFLQWVLCYYLDNFMAIFKAREAMQEKITVKKKAYIQLTDLLDISQNISKDAQGTVVGVFGIVVNTSCFTARLPKEKLDKIIRAIAKVFSQKSVSFINIQSLVGFLQFCLQAVRLGRIFMGKLQDFINHFPRAGPRTMLRRILAWVREDLEQQNKLLPAYNDVLFFDTTKMKM